MTLLTQAVGTDADKLFMMGALLCVLAFAFVLIAAWRLAFGARTRKERREKYRKRPRYEFTTYPKG